MKFLLFQLLDEILVDVVSEIRADVSFFLK
jgi:hypothetical protein